MIVKAKVISISYKSAVIAVVETSRAYIVDTLLLDGARVGSVFTLEDSLLDKATEYGIDMSVIYPEGIYINGQEFQRRLYSAGVISLEDMKKKPAVVQQVLISMISSISAEIYNKIKIVMEDYK